MSIFSFFKRKKAEATRESIGKPFRKDIQALRAFAVAAVILYHLWPNRLEGGFTGVDIFFVLSGYLMTLSVMKRLTPLIDKKQLSIRSVGGLLSDFYARRIRRLVPAALSVIVATLSLAWLTGNLEVIITNAKNAISAATFWQNWLLAKDSVDYLGQDNLIVATQHYWSLSVEEQFYLIWPLLLTISALITTSIVVLYKKSKISGAILPITLVTLLSLAYGVWLTADSQAVAYYSTPARIWELMIGGIIAFLPAIKNYDLKLLLPYGGLVLCFYSVFFIDAEGFPGWWALIPTIGAAMIVLAGTDRPESKLSFDRVFGIKPIQWLGDISYSVYLWHFPLIILVPILIHQDINGPYGRLLKLGIIAATLIIAHLSYRYIEQSTQKVDLKNRYIYILAIIATAAVVGLSMFLKHQAETKVDANLAAMHAAVLDESSHCFGARAILNQDKCGDPFGRMNNDYMSVGRTDYNKNSISNGSKNCFKSPKPASEKDSNLKEYCLLGNRDADRSIVIIGDSHAYQYVNALDAIGRNNNYRVYVVDQEGCDGINIPDRNNTCESKLPYATLNSASLVVLSFLFINYDDTKASLDNLRKATNSTVVLLEDIPRSTPEKISNCYTLRFDCDRPRQDATQLTYSILKELIDNKALDQRQLINTADMYCDASTCYSSIGGVPVYTDTIRNNKTKIDNSHVTASYSLSLAPILEQRLKSRGLL